MGFSIIHPNENGKSRGEVINADFNIPFVTDSCNISIQAQDGIVDCNTPSVMLCPTVTGGTAPFIYEWTFQGNVIASTKCIDVYNSGSYTIKVTDINGCSDMVSVKVYEDFGSPTSIITGNLILGTNGCTILDGSKSYAGHSPDSDYHLLFEWFFNGITIGDSSRITVCEAGVYTLEVTDIENGCETRKDVKVTDSCDITVTIPADTLTCTHTEFTLCPVITGGTAAFAYSWTGPSGFSSANVCITDSIPGDYVLSVTDSEGCSAVDTASVLTSIHTLNVDISKTDITCFGTCDGQVSINVSGGTPPYSYTYSPVFNVEDGLCPGDYSITVVDAEGCSDENNFSIKPATPILIDFGAIPDLDCNTTEVTLCPTITGGMPPYSYNWIDGSNSACITISTAGEWSLTVTDSKGCISEKSTILSEGPTVPAITFSQENYSIKPGDCINLGFTTTLLTYTVEWSGPNGFSSTEESPQICEAGSYTLTVTNPENDCFAVATIMVEIETANINLDKQSIKIYPNPTSDLIQIDFSEKVQGTISVYSLQGQQLKQKPISNINMSLDLSAFSTGVYFLKIETSNGVLYDKILKE